MLTVILTGGASRRMGRDKATLEWNGTTMLQSLIDRYAALGPVAVSVDRTGRFSFRGAAELVDRFPGMGPLNGLVSGFESTDEPLLLLTATDLPFGEPALARRLEERIGDAGAAVLRRGVKGMEPLFAVYAGKVLPAARDCLASGKKSYRDLFERIAVRFVLPEEVPEFDLEYILTNVNTLEEYAGAKNQKY